ncbi:hypothetical protein L6164_014452 [Bauhinia variegata]|uniref:Uncharacterized protein n=1 Tax=Bauhinia variegata TaxID=167791 RepID=A0ACB9NHF6_BAUVA|nr:hypothetical protein L6164_014452 [Bauhinia variegata]
MWKLNTIPIIAILGVFIFLLSSPSNARLINRLQLPSPLTGPESLAFDSNSGGPYTGASDGRIFKYAGPNEGFTEFAYTAPNRNKTICDGITDFSSLQATCGRPLGLGFNYQTGDLYVADAYQGLVKVPSKGGPATQLVTSAQGTPFRFLSALDVDPVTGMVYFTEASSTYQIRDLQTLITSRDSSGSLLRFDPSTNQTTVLLKSLSLASGVAVNRDGSFALVSEFLANRIQRFWLKGPRANTSELFLQLGGSPENIKRNSRGEFWIAVNNLLGPPPPPRAPVLPLGVRVSEAGIVIQIASLAEGFGTEAASEVQEINGTLYTGSLRTSYASIIRPFF